MHGRSLKQGRRVALAFALALGALVAAPTGSGAATGLGQTFVPSFGCGADNSLVQSASPNAAYAAPSAGVITRWAFQADASPPQLKFKVARSAGGGVFTVVGESGVVSPVAKTLNAYSTQITVVTGDVIGLFTNSSGNCAQNAGPYAIGAAPGDVQPGITQGFNTFTGLQLDVAATLEPDCDGDGLGDQTQDRNLALCGRKPPRCQGKLLSIVGTPGRDVIVGTPKRDVIAALGGRDTVLARAGRDLICGNRGRDRLFGQAGRDRLSGGRGKDRLNGGRGRDTCVRVTRKDTAKRCERTKP